MTTEGRAPETRQPSGESRRGLFGPRAQFRYGVVFLLTLVVVVFVIAAPSADWSRAVTLALEGSAPGCRDGNGTRARAGSPSPGAVRRRGPDRADSPRGERCPLRGGYGSPARACHSDRSGGDRARRRAASCAPRGVTVQAVAGALAIYLSIGLVFGWIISLMTHLGAAPYFAQHTSGTAGDRVYFSFTVLTTTGFGDFSAATPSGHALAVIEMLTGQLILSPSSGCWSATLPGAPGGRPPAQRAESSPLETSLPASMYSVAWATAPVAPRSHPRPRPR